MTNVSIDGSAGTAYTSLSLFNGGTEVLFLGKTDQRSDSFGYEPGGGSQTTATDFNSDEVYSLNVDFTFDGAGNELADITLNGQTLAGPSANKATWNNANLGASFQFDSVRLIRDGALSAGVTPTYDDTYLSAVPEPSAFALVGLGEPSLPEKCALPRGGVSGRAVSPKPAAAGPERPCPPPAQA